MKKKEKSKKEKRRNIFLHIFEFVVDGILTILDAIFLKRESSWEKRKQRKNVRVCWKSF